MTELPTDPRELRAYAERLKSLLRGWANSKDYATACRYMASIRKMIDADDPAAPDTEPALIETEDGAPLLDKRD